MPIRQHHIKNAGHFTGGHIEISGAEKRLEGEHIIGQHSLRPRRVSQENGLPGGIKRYAPKGQAQRTLKHR